MRILRAPENDDGGYGLEEPAPPPRQNVTKPLEAETYGTRTATTPKQRTSENDWNEWKGLRNAYVSLIIRCVFATIVWAIVVWIVTPAMLWLRDNTGGRQTVVIGIASLAGGFAVGYILSRGLAERAGFVSLLVTVPAVLAAIVCVFAGSLFGSLPHGDVVFTLFPNVIAIGVAGGWAAFRTMMDD